MCSWCVNSKKHMILVSVCCLHACLWSKTCCSKWAVILNTLIKWNTIIIYIYFEFSCTKFPQNSAHGKSQHNVCSAMLMSDNDCWRISCCSKFNHCDDLKSSLMFWRWKLHIVHHNITGLCDVSVIPLVWNCFNLKAGFQERHKHNKSLNQVGMISLGFVDDKT